MKSIGPKGFPLSKSALPCICVALLPVLGFPFWTVPGGDLATPEQRGLVSAAMGVATSIGVATGPGVRSGRQRHGTGFKRIWRWGI